MQNFHFDTYRYSLLITLPHFYLSLICRYSRIVSVRLSGTFVFSGLNIYDKYTCYINITCGRQHVYYFENEMKSTEGLYRIWATCEKMYFNSDFSLRILSLKSELINLIYEIKIRILRKKVGTQIFHMAQILFCKKKRQCHLNMFILVVDYFWGTSDYVLLGLKPRRIF